MALEQRDATQIVSFSPPLPQRAFAVQSSDASTETDVFPGANTDGRRYGKITINSEAWTRHSNQSIPPLVVGEKFGIYRTKGSAFNALSLRTYSTNVPPTDTSYAVASQSDNASSDILRIYDTQLSTGELVLQDEGLFTVQGIVNTNGDNGWTVYFDRPLTTDVPGDGTYGIVTYPEPMNGIWYGQLGNVQGINYTWDRPNGGPSALTFLLARPPEFRSPAMNPGRIIQAYRGGSCIWEGIQTEPSPDVTGWTITANGAATYGANYTAMYTTWNADDPINQAMARGLRWAKPEPIGKPTGIYLGSAQDTGSMVIQDFLNLLCTGGGLYWSLEPPSGSKIPAGPWEVRLREFPTDVSGNPLTTDGSAPAAYNVQSWQRTDLKKKMPRTPPDLYVINTNPVPRTIDNDYNTLVIKYQATADKDATSTKKAVAAIYKTVVVDNPDSVAAHGRNEYYMDVSASGVMTNAAVVALGQNVLRHYVRANFASDITVQPGQLINNGGYPVDLGLDWSGKLAAFQVSDGAFGGEVGYGNQTFIIGTYTFDDDTQTATITPFQSSKSDISSIISTLYPGKFS